MALTRPDTAIIIAAGDATRWGDYMGVPKHLVEVDGEPILHRTARLLRERVDTVWVVSKNDARYHQHGSTILTIEPGSSDADKFYSSKDIWCGHTLIVYGDCYFTQAAIDTMCAPVEDWTLFCRPTSSAITGSPYGECWAYSIPENRLTFFEDRLVWLAGLHELGVTHRCGGWELYQALLGQDVNEHRMTTNYVVIDDWSEDFDYPRDYDMWLHNRVKSRYTPIDPFDEPDEDSDPDPVPAEPDEGTSLAVGARLDRPHLSHAGRRGRQHRTKI